MFLLGYEVDVLFGKLSDDVVEPSGAQGEAAGLDDLGFAGDLDGDLVIGGGELEVALGGFQQDVGE